MADKEKKEFVMPTQNMPIRITAIYLLLGTIWIAFSDRLVESVVTDVNALTRIQTYKGWFYVFATSALLYWITKRYEGTIKASERQMYKSRQRYKGLVESVDDWIVAIDSENKIIFASPKVHKLLGYYSREVIGKDIIELLESGKQALKHDIYPVFDKKMIFKQLQIEVKRRDGKRIFLDLSGTPRTHEGIFKGYCMVIRDVTKQKLTQDSLAESEILFRAVAETTSAGIFILQGNNFVYINKAAEKVTGYTHDEILKLHFLDVVHPDHKEMVKERAFARMSGQQVTPHYEFKIISKQGEERWVDYSGQMLEYKGKPAILGSAFDVTDRKRSQMELETSQAELSAIFSSMTDIVMVLDADGRYLKIGPISSPLLYRPSNELLNKTLFDVFPRETADLFFEAIQKTLRSSQAQHLEYSLTINNHIYWFSATVSKMAGNSVVWVARDITDYKKVEQELKDSRETYRSVAQTASDAIITIDEKSRILFTNTATTDIFGYTKKELIGQKITMIMPERMRQRHISSIQNYMDTGQKHTSWHNLELPGLHKNGYEMPLEISYGEFIQDGHHIFTGIIRDISGRKTVEEALRESEEKYRKLVESANDAIFISDAETGQLLDVNERGEELVGRPRAELIGKNQTILHPLEEAERYRDIFNSAVTVGRAITKDLYAQRKDGRKVPIEISSSLTEVKGRKIVQGIFRDITERKQAEEALQQKDAQIRRAYVDVFSAVTGGRLIIMTEEEVAEALGNPVSEEIDVPTYEALYNARTTIKNVLHFNFPTIKNVEDIITAANEAITNAVKHAGSGKLQIFEGKKTAQIMIADWGPGIDFSILPKATLLTGFSTKQSLGLGFNIMLEYSDRLVLSTKPGRTIIVLEVNI